MARPSKRRAVRSGAIGAMGAVGAIGAGASGAAPAPVAPIAPIAPIAPGKGLGTAPVVAQPEDSAKAAITIMRGACEVEGRIPVHYRRDRARSTVLTVT